MNTQETMSFLTGVHVTSPVSDGDREDEVKYLLAQDKCEQAFASANREIAKILAGKPFELHEFKGLDYVFDVTDRFGKPHSFRYRTGNPVSGRMGVKSRVPGSEYSRTEIEFDIVQGEDETRTLDKVLKYHRHMASLIGEVRETRVRVAGNIRYLRIGVALQQKIEVVVFTGCNAQTGKMVTVAEIEAHHFPNPDEAKAFIDKYEDLLGWGNLRTLKSMSELVS